MCINADLYTNFIFNLFEYKRFDEKKVTSNNCSTREEKKYATDARVETRRERRRTARIDSECRADGFDRVPRRALSRHFVFYFRESPRGLDTER